jgi:hypothetical protein
VWWRILLFGAMLFAVVEIEKMLFRLRADRTSAPARV